MIATALRLWVATVFLSLGVTQTVLAQPFQTFIETGQLPAHAWSMQFTADGKQLVRGGFGSRDDVGQCSIWDVSTGKMVWMCPERGSEGVNQVSIDNKSEFLAISFKYSGVLLWNLKLNEKVALPEDFEAKQCRYASISQDGQWLFVQRSQPEQMRVDIEVWDIPSLARKATLDAGYLREPHLISASGESVFLAQRDAILRWNWQTTEGSEPILQTSRARDLALSSEGTHLAWARGRFVSIADLRTGQITQELEHEGIVQIRDVEFSPDSTQVVSLGSDKFNMNPSAVVWAATSGEKLQTLPRPRGMAFAIAFAPDGSRIALGGEGKESSITLWSKPAKKKE